MEKLTRKECNDIAKVMIASTSLCFDRGAFSDCDELIEESEQQMIIDEINKEAIKIYRAVQKKYSDEIDISSTEGIITSMFFEAPELLNPSNK